MDRLKRAQLWASKAAGNKELLEKNYFCGIPVTIENPKGSVRYGDNWIQVMNHDYGYIDGTVGADGDEVDVFIGPDLCSTKCYIVDQIDPLTGRFDEHKVMLGFSSIGQARDAYNSNYQQGWRGLRHICEINVVDLWAWYRYVSNL